MIRRMLFHLACVVALAWPAFLNGQPFYFPDSTAYVRAADSAAYIFSGHRIRSEWTAHYARSLEPGGKVRDADRHVSPRGNDLGTESIMAGRSPYFGALLWLSYMLGRFWLFVLGQAAIAYALIRLTLRLFGLARPLVVAGTVAALALLTSLPFFTGLLMPDLLAGFGILAFLLLAIERGRLAPAERWSLYALMAASAVAHLTHILVIAAMVAVLLVWGLVARWPRRRFLPLAGSGATIVLIGLLSVMLTSAMVEHVFGRKPLLVPLLTARFIADGPGLDYLRSHCPEAGFAACAWAGQDHMGAGEFLWSHDPKVGGYMFADTATRRALSAEDKAFALAVLAEYPIEQGGRILRNGLRQMLRFEVDLANSHCATPPHCWTSLPPRERATLAASPAGRGLWPQRGLAGLHYGVVGLALIAVVSCLAGRRDRAARDIGLWCALLLAAMAANALLGGGVSEPQPRYQARIIWLLPLVAIVAGLVWRRRHSVAEVDG
ncbi:hypothetical protein [Rhizorhabdus dicambivorans]|uniref:Glycosyltransferase RgtA/B/C/D-like domain-containing protein n=1 Tax=Rhizorhabdus dicambivorans TaxID=1850238 RepID=A0A2A4FW99_9SPHN|nr:hypothetical protein [Rhizorhabdus dicambivorans]ATE65360.1 hypothetical protein CMV14_13900 [Rhizorhabdus dicambivorans]PCE42474.1 hypothetical protein COO09_09880 [Rhizorhabdus dicambivorans]